MRCSVDVLAVFAALTLCAGCGDDEPASGTGGSSATGGSGGDAGTGAANAGGGGSGTGGVGTGGTGTGGIGTGGTGGVGTGGTGGMGMQDTESDDFEAQMLSANWEVIFPPPPNTQVQIIGDSDLGMGPGPQGFFLVNWIGSSFADDQFCEATIPLDVNVDWIHQVYVRWRQSDKARYGFGYAGDPNQAVFGNWIFKYDGVPGPQTRIVAQVLADVVTPPVPGDTLRVEIEGYELRGYKNGMLVMTATDTDPSKIAGGRVGLAARWANGNTSTGVDVKVWESWSGGSL